MNEIKKYIAKELLKNNISLSCIKDKILVDMTMKRKYDDCIIFTLIDLIKSKAKELEIKKLTLCNIDTIYNDIIQKSDREICYIADEMIHPSLLCISAYINEAGKLTGKSITSSLGGGFAGELKSGLHFCIEDINEDVYLEKVKEKLFRGYKSKYIETYIKWDDRKTEDLLAELSYYRIQKNNELYINEYMKIKKTNYREKLGGWR